MLFTTDHFVGGASVGITCVGLSEILDDEFVVPSLLLHQH